MSQLRTMKANPLSPKYRVAGKNGSTEIIGEISGQRPKPTYERKIYSERDNLSCKINSVEWAPANEKYRPKLFMRQTAGALSS